MKTWSLLYNGKKLSLSDWGISNLKRTRISQGRDTVSFDTNGQKINEAPLFKPETTVQILKGDKPWFHGIITTVPNWGDAKREINKCIVAGPWWYLENLVFQQSWAQAGKLIGDKPNIDWVETGRVILGQDREGTPIDNGRQIREILEYAKAQGAPFEIGDIGVDTPLPYDETKDISCAEAIQRMLRWTPDAVCWFDYEATPLPRLHIKRRKDLARATLSLDGNSSVKDIKVTPRSDLQSPAVVIKYEKNHVINGTQWTTTDIDRFPETATGREFKALVLTVELDGSRGQHVRQEIKTAFIEPQHAHWWQQHVPALAGIPPP